LKHEIHKFSNLPANGVVKPAPETCIGYRFQYNSWLPRLPQATFGNQRSQGVKQHKKMKGAMLHLTAKRI